MAVGGSGLLEFPRAEAPCGESVGIDGVLGMAESGALRLPDVALRTGEPKELEATGAAGTFVGLDGAGAFPYAVAGVLN